MVLGSTKLKMKAILPTATPRNMKKRGSISLNGRPSFFPKTKTVTFNEVPTDIGEPRIDISNKGPYFLALVSRYSKEQVCSHTNRRGAVKFDHG
jgi:hypothetical protein